MAENFFERRVSESEIARILQLIHDLPDKHQTRLPSDMEGSYDFWFKGGGCIIHTGRMEFHFEDGTKAHVGAPIAWTSIVIEFPSGETVKIEQKKN